MAWDLLLVLILGIAIYLRFTGISWGEAQYLHPDERFLVWVTADIRSVNNLGEYFNTAISTLNPHNVGHGFFVYGTFPIILTHYLTSMVFELSGWEQVLVTGRSLSAIFDLLTVLLVFLIGERLFDRRVGVLGAAFSALAVMQIQQSHFYTSDSFATSFSTLALYFAVLLAGVERPRVETGSAGKLSWLRSGTLRNSVLFGIAVGLALACKINTAPIAILLPAAWLIRILRMDAAERRAEAGRLIRDLAVGGLAAFLVFRIAQPYAFQGPSFFNILPNERWVQNLQSLAAQTSGDVDFPPALQWARRPITFSLQNMVFWGMGLPMGVLAWAGFLWCGWRILKKRWPVELLVWGWTAAYFTWQSLQGNPTMRYQLPIYPPLAMLAGWTLVQVWDSGRHKSLMGEVRKGRWIRGAAVLAGVIALAVTGGWAYGFSRIYTQPVTRVEASRWIFQNVAGPVNLAITREDQSIYQQPLPYEPARIVNSGSGLRMSFVARSSGLLTRVVLGNIRDLTANEGTKTLILSVRPADESDRVGYGSLVDFFQDTSASQRTVQLDIPLRVDAGEVYRIEVALLGNETALGMTGQPGIYIQSDTGEVYQHLPPVVDTIRRDRFQEIRFQAAQSGTLEEVTFFRIMDETAAAGIKTLEVSLFNGVNLAEKLGSGQVTDAFLPTAADARGQGFSVQIQPAVDLKQGEVYTLRMDMVDGDGALAVYGSAIANESTWDDGLPLRMGGYDPFGGIYQRDLSFEMYWDDNAEKRGRFLSILDNADTLVISSNRQWGTTTRVPERYPLTTAYYRNLLGCPDEDDLLWCYRVAQPGMFSGSLGYDLVEVFQSNPKIGNLEINDQFAEEAFTVYDHPKVFIFKKNPEYDPVKTAEILHAVDLSMAVRVIPGRAPSYPVDLMLPSDRLARQQSGGTWAELYNSNALINRYPGIGLAVWYLVILLLGWMIYPILRVGLSGLPDKGFPLAKTAALLLLSWLVWLAGSLEIAFNWLTITAVVLGLAAVSVLLTAWQWKSLAREIHEKKRYFLTVEAIGLALFGLFVLIRLGNPDLWHPSFGGEKPMDFAYFNAILKSTTFPPYNPWYSGSYINYYYYGFVLVGVPVKWLGIVPAIAYNLILPTMASLFGLGAFSAGWNLIKGLRHTPEDGEQGVPWMRSNRIPLVGGLVSIAATLVIGNLGTVRMIWHGIMRVVAPGGTVEGANIFLKLSWTFQGLAQVFAGARLPYSTGDWYWIPSRALPGEAITEFPFFTFLYADPHAHLFALPLTLLALGWCLSIVFGKWQWKNDEAVPGWLTFGITFFLGGLAIGVLRPANTWDMPTYLGLGVAAVFYSALRHTALPSQFLPFLPAWARRLVAAGAASIMLTGLSFLLFEPYAHWYAQGYTNIDVWKGGRSPLASYLTHWGLFLFIILTWMTTETIDWMAKTPLSALNKLRRYQYWIYFFLAGYLFSVLYLVLVAKVPTGWFSLTLAVWSLLLLLRPGQPDAKRGVLFMIGSAIVLTLAVEVVVLVGDIGRMNTVFKFYLQAWNLLAISAVAAGLWVAPVISRQLKPNWRTAWTILAVGLVSGAMLYPLLAGSAKIRDRMSQSAPHGLDGMAYMLTSQYYDQGGVIDLSQDYRAIRWMQENIKGSPVIVEATTVEYRWGSRFSIYTGLPTVIGWNWHQRQQRAVLIDTSIHARVAEVSEFYNTTSYDTAKAFVDKYRVKYIVVGQVERIYYDSPGLAKFDSWNDDLWTEVYRDKDTVIYEVIQ